MSWFAISVVLPVSTLSCRSKFSTHLRHKTPWNQSYKIWKVTIVELLERNLEQLGPRTGEEGDGGSETVGGLPRCHPFRRDYLHIIVSINSSGICTLLFEPILKCELESVKRGNVRSSEMVYLCTDLSDWNLMIGAFKSKAVFRKTYYTYKCLEKKKKGSLAFRVLA